MTFYFFILNSYEFFLFNISLYKNKIEDNKMKFDNLWKEMGEMLARLISGTNLNLIDYNL